HEIAIVVGRRSIVIVFEAVALGKACQVEPMPPPALAVMLIGEQAVDEALVGIRGWVANERLHLLGLGRQAQQIEKGSPDQVPPVDGGIGLQSLGFKLRKDEAIDGCSYPGAILNSRQYYLIQRLKRPKLSRRGRYDPLRPRYLFILARKQRAVVGGAVVDP